MFLDNPAVQQTSALAAPAFPAGRRIILIAVVSQFAQLLEEERDAMVHVGTKFDATRKRPRFVVPASILARLARFSNRIG